MSTFACSPGGISSRNSCALFGSRRQESDDLPVQGQFPCRSWIHGDDAFVTAVPDLIRGWRFFQSAFFGDFFGEFCGDLPDPVGECVLCAVVLLQLYIGNEFEVVTFDAGSFSGRTKGLAESGGVFRHKLELSVSDHDAVFKRSQNPLINLRPGDVAGGRRARAQIDRVHFLQILIHERDAEKAINIFAKLAQDAIGHIRLRSEEINPNGSNRHAADIRNPFVHAPRRLFPLLLKPIVLLRQQFRRIVTAILQSLHFLQRILDPLNLKPLRIKQLEELLVQRRPRNAPVLNQRADLEHYFERQIQSARRIHDRNQRRVGIRRKLQTQGGGLSNGAILSEISCSNPLIFRSFQIECVHGVFRFSLLIDPRSSKQLKQPRKIRENLYNEELRILAPGKVLRDSPDVFIREQKLVLIIVIEQEQGNILKPNPELHADINLSPQHTKPVLGDLTPKADRRGVNFVGVDSWLHNGSFHFLSRQQGFAIVQRFVSVIG
nr:hypothetical protein Iba_chr08dCG5610 [Ipomoea batatas]